MKATVHQVTYKNIHARFGVDNHRDHIQRHWLQGAFYEAGRNGLLAYLHGDPTLPHGTALDIGAHQGNHAVFLAKLGFRVLALEPWPRNMRRLRANIELNRLTKQVWAVPMAAGSTPGAGHMTPGPADNSGMARLTAEGPVDVRIGAVDDLSFPGPATLIKIDVEGMELDVLEGARGLIERHHPVIAVETDHPDRVLALLREEGVYQLVAGPLNATPTYVFR